MLRLIFAPGFFTSAPVQTALILAGGAAVVAGLVGVFTILRGQSFAGHALADISSAGGAAAYLLGLAPLCGFLGVAVLGALAMSGGTKAQGVGRAAERDLLTGIVLGAGLGLTALLLYFDVTMRSTTGAAVTVMFGSMFAIPPGMASTALGVAVVALALMAAIWRPLLLSSLAPELARVRGVRVGLISLVHLLVLALSVTLCAMTIGAILATALLIGPAAAALRLARRPAVAVLAAMLIGLGACWGGILLAYDSYGWTGGHGWPVSFFIVALIFAAYLASGLVRRRPGLGVRPVAGGG
ncbi:MAG: cation ABC transporter permease [Rhodospirillales bacterium 20-64-7]|nr:MAG: cation ABC transporter permease [Rhodospirillales bacterium 20-64-7]